jgi:predicted aspartyl protease
MRKAVFLGGLLASIAPSAWAACRMDRVATMPLLGDGRPIVQASIEGQDFPMTVDTGAEGSSVTPATAGSLGLWPDTTRQTIATSVGGRDVSSNALVGKLALGRVDFQQLSLAVLPLDGTVGGGPVPAGLIGADLLSTYDLEFDFPGRALTLWHVAGCLAVQPPWGDTPYQTVRVTISDHHQLRFPVELNGQPLAAVFDTGSVGETGARAAAQRIGVSTTELDRDPIDGGSSAGEHAYQIRRHPFATLRIGAEMFRSPLLDVVDFDQSGTDMLVGMDYMRARRFFVSYATGTLFIQRGPPPSVAMASGATGRCRAPADLLPNLSHLAPVAVSRPRLEGLDKLRAEHLDGCAGVTFHLAPDGTPTDLGLIIEWPTGYGLGDYVMHELAATKFLVPAGGRDAVYYETHRFQPD